MITDTKQPSNTTDTGNCLKPLLGVVFFEDKIKYQITAHVGLNSFLIINDSTKKFHYSPLVVLEKRFRELRLTNEMISEENLRVSKKFVNKNPKAFNASFQNIA